MSEQSNSDINTDLGIFFKSLQDIDPYLKDVVDGYKNIENADILDDFIADKLGLTPKHPKLIEKLFVVDYDDVKVWSTGPSVIKQECRVSSIIEMASEIGSKEIERFPDDHCVCLQLNLGLVSAGIRYSQSEIEDADIIKALQHSPQKELAKSYELVVTEKPEFIDWSAKHLFQSTRP